jgi:ABC-type branched-subunit amino acid transport system ATPase component
MSDAVLIEHLARRFGDTTAVDDVSLNVSSGELFGFIGPDGGDGVAECGNRHRGHGSGFEGR